jgi:hypothetical protein
MSDSLELVSAPLTTQEKVRLGQLERIVEKNLTGFVQCGRALLEIREDRLWRGQYASFADYCKERFGICRSTGDQLVRATQVFETLAAATGAPDSDTPVPETVPEIVLRPIARLPGPELLKMAVRYHDPRQTRGRFPSDLYIRPRPYTTRPDSQPFSILQPPVRSSAQVLPPEITSPTENYEQAPQIR